MKERAIPQDYHHRCQAWGIYHHWYWIPHSVDRATGTYYVDYTTGSRVKRKGFGIQFFCPHKWVLMGYSWWWETKPE